MADERDIQRARLGLAPLPTPSPAKPTPIVDERTQAKAKTKTADQLEAIRAQMDAADALAAAKKITTKDTGTKTGTETGTETGTKTGTKTTSNNDAIQKALELLAKSLEDGGGGGGGGGGDSSAAADYYAKLLQQQQAAAELAAKQAAAEKTAAEKAARQSAYDLLYQQFDAYGLGALVLPLKGLIESGISPAEFTIKLRETDAYKKRFAANTARINKGLRALSEAEYIGLEDQYQDVMRRYGLPQEYYARGDMGRQEGFEKFIGGDVSPVELEDRVQTAQRRVINAAPQVKDALSQYYGNEISNGDILAYVLDPDKAIENIKRKVTAAEIGGGAMRAGLGVARTRAEELGQYGVTGEQAITGFGTIASGLERGRQLSQIYQQPDYTQAVAETEVFNLPDAEKARRQRRKLGQLETAEFGGTSGITGGALSRERAGQY